jgi:hypothetical protein
MKMSIEIEWEKVDKEVLTQSLPIFSMGNFRGSHSFNLRGQQEEKEAREEEMKRNRQFHERQHTSFTLYHTLDGVW